MGSYLDFFAKAAAIAEGSAYADLGSSAAASRSFLSTTRILHKIKRHQFLALARLAWARNPANSESLFEAIRLVHETRVEGLRLGFTFSGPPESVDPPTI